MILGTRNILTTDVEGAQAIAVAYTNSTTLSDTSCVINGTPIALYTLTNGTFALGVTVDATAALSVATTTVNTNEIALAENNEDSYVICVESVSSAVNDSFTMFRTVALGIDSNERLIVKKATFTPDERRYIMFGHRKVGVYRHGQLWYLAVLDLT